MIELLRMAPVFGSEHLLDDVASLAALFGEPSLVDGERYAQFDTPVGRICLAARDEVTGSFALLLRVADLTDAMGLCEENAMATSAITVGEHEERFGATTPSGLQMIFYRPVSG